MIYKFGDSIHCDFKRKSVLEAECVCVCVCLRVSVCEWESLCVWMCVWGRVCFPDSTGYVSAHYIQIKKKKNSFIEIYFNFLGI